MEQIALISDLHANLPAVEAVFDDIFKRDIKRIFCLGDFVGKGAKPDEVITLCRKSVSYTHLTLPTTPYV